MFDVKVESVNIMNVNLKQKEWVDTLVKQKKKAIVKLKI